MTFQNFLKMVSNGQAIEVAIEAYGRTFLTRAFALDLLTSKDEESARLRELYVLKIGTAGDVLAVRLG